MQIYAKPAICALSILLLIPGCCRWGKKADADQSHKEKKAMSRVRKSKVHIDAPDSDDSSGAQNFFDDLDSEQGFLLEDEEEHLADAVAVLDRIDTTGNVEEDVSQFAWAEETEAVEEDTEEDRGEAFKVVYYGFDKSSLDADQDEVIEYNAELAKRKLALEDTDARIEVEGFACDSAGTESYNQKISERRAKDLRSRLIAKGVPADRIEAVGKGNKNPAYMDGRPVTGGRQEQWANRRSEVRIVT